MRFAAGSVFGAEGLIRPAIIILPGEKWANGSDPAFVGTNTVFPVLGFVLVWTDLSNVLNFPYNGTQTLDYEVLSRD